MAKKSFPPTEAGSADFPDAEALPVTSTDTAPAEPTAAHAPAPEAVRSDRSTFKPGVRKITLAQARAHHAKA